MGDLSPAIEILRKVVRTRFADRRMIANGLRSEWRVRSRAEDVAAIRSSIAAIRILAQKAHVCLRCGGRGPERPCTPACVDWQVARFMAWAGSPERENENG